MTRKTQILKIGMALTLSFSLLGNAHAAREKEETPPPTVYTERAKNMLDSLVAEDLIGDIMMLSEKEREDLLRSLREKDDLVYSPYEGLSEDNAPLKVDMVHDRKLDINLGHTYNTTLTFKDTLGNPWSFQILSDVSNEDVVSVDKIAPHILNIRPQKKSW